MRKEIATDYAQTAIKLLLAAIFVGSGIAAMLVPAAASPLSSPLPPAPGRLQISAWMPTSWDGDSARASFDAHMDSLSVISPFWYGVRADGSLAAWGGSRDAMLVQQARDAGVLVIPTISNQFDGDIIHAILNDPARAEAHRRGIVDEVRRYGYDGVDLDYENLAAADKDLFSAWVAALADDLHARGKLLTITVQPKTFDADGWDGPGAQDYRALAGAADELRLMTYGWCWRTGCVGGDPPGPIAPIHWMQRVIDYAKTQAPADKLVLGVHLYGYDWSGAQTRCNAPAADLSLSRPGIPADDLYETSPGWLQVRRTSVVGAALVWEEAEALRAAHNAPLQWWESDDRGLVQEPWFSYADGAHNVTFANANSVAARARLAADAGLRGVIFWRLGGEDPALWARLPQRVYRAWLPWQTAQQASAASR